MKRIALLLISGSLLLTVSGQTGGKPYISKSLSGLAISQVSAETSGGNIAVWGVPDGEARLEVYARDNHGDELGMEDIKRRLDEYYDLTISTDDHKLRVVARPKRNMNWKQGLSLSFKIYAPEKVSTVLRTSGGNITMKKLSGDVQDVRTSGGNLDLDQLTGKVRGATSGGNVNISDSKEDIEVVTSGGNIEATHCEGNLRMATSGGNLKIRLLKGTIRATTSGGDVRGEEIEGELTTRTSGGNIKLSELSCSLNGSTSGGDITVGFRALGKFLTLTNSSGNVKIQMPSGKGLDLHLRGDRVNVGSLADFKGKFDEKHIDGSLNGGGVPVNVENSNGNVDISFR